MSKINICELRAHLSEYLSEVKAGGVVTVCERNVPIAEIHQITPHLKEPRPFGLGKDKIKISPAFFDPLPDDILDAFEGKT